MSKVSTNLIGLGGVLSLCLLAGCATSPRGQDASMNSAENAKRARPYLEGSHAALATENTATCRWLGDVPTSASSKAPPSTPKGVVSWKDWVLAGGACVREERWSDVLRIGEWLSQNEMEAPWGPYFLGLHAQAQGELLRAHWLLDLAERKAGGELSIVQYERARQSLLNGETREAVSHMKTAVAKDAELAPAHLWLAQVHEREQLWEEAATHYAKYLSLRPKSAPAHFAFAEVQLIRQKPQEAVEPLLRAIHLDPSSLKVRLRLAVVYEQLLKDPESSLKVLREARSVASSSARSASPGAARVGQSRSERNSDSMPGRDSKIDLQQIDLRIRQLEDQMKARQPAQAQGMGPSAQHKAKSPQSDQQSSESPKGGG